MELIKIEDLKKDNEKIKPFSLHTQITDEEKPAYYCEISQGKDDELIGIYFAKEKNGIIKPVICFPIGYKMPNKDNARKEILHLIKVLQRFKNKKEGINELNTQNKTDDEFFPISAYMDVINYFMLNGYYKEREHEYKIDTRGKINWKRTINTQKPLIQDTIPIYTKFVIKKNQINENDIITEIHKYCVADGLFKIGFLYNIDYTMNQYHAKMSHNKAFLDKAKMVLKNRLHHTNNDKLKRLFNSMIMILDPKDYLDNNFAGSQYGTKSFNLVWEGMIDKVFGISQKEKENYYPKIKYTLFDGKKKDPDIKPDTIMFGDNGDDNVYVLDAKYYRYGVTFEPKHLPAGESVVKQIAYGEYVYNKVNEGKIPQDIVYNAFIMPYNDEKDDTKNIKYVGRIEVEWKETKMSYETIKLILLDTKYIMNLVFSSEDEKKEAKKKLAFILKTFVNCPPI